MNKKFLILGGDDRSLYLGEYLEKQSLNVCYYAFRDTDCFKTLKEAVFDVDCIILPLPFTRDRVTLNAPLFDEKIQIADICALIDSSKAVFGGQLPKSFCEELDLKGVYWCDYFSLEELAVFNAVPTAEGVIGILIDKLPITVRSMKCAVTGYGKIGKAVAASLKALGADVTVIARKPRDAAEILSQSMHTCTFKDLKIEKNDFDVLINTVPAKVIGKEEMNNLKSDCLLLEVASPPFGIDFGAAKEHALTVIKASSLPGKVAPKTAGEIIGKTILPIFEKKGLIP